jgi:uncharacterized membrane protein YgcG
MHSFRTIRWLLVCSACVLLVPRASAQAEHAHAQSERILDFHSDITVEDDSSLPFPWRFFFLPRPLFIYLLKAPTIAGRLMLDRAKGFKMFLGKVEGNRLNRTAPPQQTPEVFERYLPYALALDVEQHWAEQFSGVLGAAGWAPGSPPAYVPSFYSGSWWNGSSGTNFASSFSSSFTSAISSSSAAPGSSSGSGGGGGGSGVGGGGGGGGGGGW